MIAAEVIDKVEFVHFQTEERGAVYILGENPKDAKRSLKLKFDDTPVQQSYMGGTTTIYLGSVRVNNKIGDTFEPDELGRLKLERIYRMKAYQKGIVKYVPSPEEMRQKTKLAEQARFLEEQKKLLTSGVFSRPNFDIDLEGLRDYAEKIGSKLYDKNGRPLSKVALKNAICGTLGIEGEFGAKAGNQNAKKSKPKTDDNKE